jgi:hypothetical protein
MPKIKIKQGYQVEVLSIKRRWFRPDTVDLRITGPESNRRITANVGDKIGIIVEYNTSIQVPIGSEITIINDHGKVVKC